MEKSTRVFHLNDKDYIFNFDRFEYLFKQYAQTEEYSYRQIEELLADKAFVSRDAVRNWRRRKNGMDLDVIKRVADFLGIDYMELIKEKAPMEDEGTCIVELSDKQYDAVYRIYCAAVDFLEELLSTDGLFDAQTERPSTYWADKAYRTVEVAL